MNVNEQLLTFLDHSPTPFHAIHNIREILLSEGYTELFEKDEWELNAGKYFVTRNLSSIIAFRIPEGEPTGFMIGASHSDSPALKIKENPEIVKDGYVKLNVEGYGGMLCAPWFDRPLSVAGRVVLQEDNRIITRLINIDRDLLILPSLAIHMNRSANKGYEYNMQNDMCPLLGSEEVKGKFMSLIAETAGCDADKIMGYDLYLYIREKGSIWGADQEYVSAMHLDDLQCGFADLHGFLQASGTSSIPVLVVFDNEEVGSLTKQGADSTFLHDIMKRIAHDLGKDEVGYMRLLASSFMVSADNSHAVHPNHADKSDPVNRPKMNQGIVIKHEANQKYTSDAISTAVFREICKEADVPVQIFTNRSDLPGGSTLGSISNGHVSLNTVDVGLPQLSMHSPYETAGVKDTEYLIRAMKVFFSKTLVDDGNGNYTIQ